jgi:hypothetical protein
MGIEPTRTALQSLWNTALCEGRAAACDWRANFRLMRDNVRQSETTAPLLEGQVCGKGIHPKKLQSASMA